MRRFWIHKSFAGNTPLRRSGYALGWLPDGEALWSFAEVELAVKRLLRRAFVFRRPTKIQHISGESGQTVFYLIYTQEIELPKPACCVLEGEAFGSLAEVGLAVKHLMLGPRRALV